MSLKKLSQAIILSAVSGSGLLQASSSNITSGFYSSHAQSDTTEQTVLTHKGGGGGRGDRCGGGGRGGGQGADGSGGGDGDGSARGGRGDSDGEGAQGKRGRKGKGHGGKRRSGGLPSASEGFSD